MAAALNSRFLPQYVIYPFSYFHCRARIIKRQRIKCTSYAFSSCFLLLVVLISSSHCHADLVGPGCFLVVEIDAHCCSIVIVVSNHTSGSASSQGVFGVVIFLARLLRSMWRPCCVAVMWCWTRVHVRAVSVCKIRNSSEMFFHHVVTHNSHRTVTTLRWVCIAEILDPRLCTCLTQQGYARTSRPKYIVFVTVCLFLRSTAQPTQEFTCCVENNMQYGRPCPYSKSHLVQSAVKHCYILNHLRLSLSHMRLAVFFFFCGFFFFVACTFFGMIVFCGILVGDQQVSLLIYDFLLWLWMNPCFCCFVLRIQYSIGKAVGIGDSRAHCCFTTAALLLLIASYTTVLNKK